MAVADWLAAAAAHADALGVAASAVARAVPKVAEAGLALIGVCSALAAALPRPRPGRRLAKAARRALDVAACNIGHAANREEDGGGHP